MSKSLIIGICMSATFVALAAVSFLWTPYDIETLDIKMKSLNFDKDESIIIQ